VPADLVEGLIPRDRKLRNRISLTALLLGVGLLWPFPLGAAVLMVAAAFALVISLEDALTVSPPVLRTADNSPRKETQ
jgi:hypothetical protein